MMRAGAGFVCAAVPSATAPRPADIAAVLQLLAAAPVTQGSYHPHITMTNSYPYALILLLLPEETLVLAPKSQGKTRVPWGMTIDRAAYAPYASEIAAALELLTADGLCLAPNLRQLHCFHLIPLPQR